MFMKMRSNSVATKVLIPVIILLLLVVAGLSVYNTYQSTGTVRTALNDQVSWISRYGQDVYTDLLDSGLATVQVLRGLSLLALEEGMPRDELFRQMRAPLGDQESVLGTWIAFEPNGYDGQDAAFAGVEPFTSQGRFASYWYRTGGSIDAISLSEYQDEPYYSVPLETGEPYLSEPYEYQAGEEQLSLITIALPIRSNGSVVGVVGVDMDLAASQEIISSIRPLETGYTFAVTGSGIVAAHPTREIVMTEASQYFQDPEAFRTAIRDHETYTETKRAVGGQQSESLFVVAPFSIDAFDETWFFGVSVPTAVIQEQVRRAVVAGIVASAVAVLIALAILIPLLLRLTRPIRRSAAAIQSISEGAGDLTQRMQVTTNDEVGVLGASFNRFIEYQNEFIKGLKNNAEQTEGAKNEVVASAEETSASIRQIGANVESISKQMDTLDSTVNNSAAALEQTNASIQSIDSQISEQATMVEETSSSINEISASLSSTAKIAQQKIEAAEELNRTVSEGQERLSEAEQAMQSVVERLSAIEQMNAVINDIAAQTNLLSMNAAIEAAHAGESGRGFAVVAEEIRKLAGQASESSKEINESVRQISDSIERSSTTVRQSAASFTKIISEAESTGNALTEIGASVEEMSAGGEQIMRATQALNDAVTKVKDGFQEIATSSQQLLAANGELRNISGSAKYGITEINTGVQEIVEAAGNLVRISSNLDGVVSELNSQVGQFKTE